MMLAKDASRKNYSKEHISEKARRRRVGKGSRKKPYKAGDPMVEKTVRD